MYFAMFAAARKHGRLHKNRVSIAFLALSQGASLILSGNKELGSSTPTSAPPGPATKPRLNPTVLWMPKYTKDDL